MAFLKFIVLFASVFFFGTFLMMLMIRFVIGDNDMTETKMLGVLLIGAFLFAYGMSI